MSDRDETPELVAASPLPPAIPWGASTTWRKTVGWWCAAPCWRPRSAASFPCRFSMTTSPGRVRAGMIMKLAERRRVDIAISSAELLGDPREGTAVRNATLTAATLIALKLAWRKFFALLAIGRRAEDMVTSFQLGMLFDHYCAKLHVGAGIDRAQAVDLRAAIFAAVARVRTRGARHRLSRWGRVLGRSVLEAPTWMSDRIERAARRWSESGGQTADPGDDIEGEGGTEDARWLDKAAGAVESRLGRVGQTYLSALVRSFERRWLEVEAARKAAPTPPPSGGTGAG